MARSLPSNDPSPPPCFILRGHTAPVNTLTFNHNATYLYSGTTEGEIKMWNMQTKRCIASTKTNDGHGIVKVHVRDETMVSQDSSGTISIWSLKEHSLVKSHEWDPFRSISMANATHVPFSKSAMSEGASQLIAIASDQHPRYIDLLDIRDKVYVQGYKDTAKLGLCMDILFMHDQFICGGFENGSICCWDMRLPEKCLFSVVVDAEPVLCLDMCNSIVESGTLQLCEGVSGGAGNQVAVFQLDPTGAKKTGQVPVPNNGIADIAVRRDSKIFASAGWDHRVRIFSWKNRQPLAILKFHTDSVYCVDFPSNPYNDTFLLASGSKDKRIAIWDVYNKVT